MKTLVLGHCYDYDKNSIRCSPIDVEQWFNEPFVCVDMCADPDNTDIVYDVYRSVDYRNTHYNALCGRNKGVRYKGYWVWAFAENNSLDRIFDCMGNMNWDSTKTRYKEQDSLLQTVQRVLAPGGKFYSYFGIYTKSKTRTGHLIFEPKVRRGYQYAEQCTQVKETEIRHNTTVLVHKHSRQNT